jgi:hypothetical protein
MLDHAATTIRYQNLRNSRSSASMIPCFFWYTCFHFRDMSSLLQIWILEVQKVHRSIRYFAPYVLDASHTNRYYVFMATFDGALMIAACTRACRNGYQRLRARCGRLRASLKAAPQARRGTAASVGERPHLPKRTAEMQMHTGGTQFGTSAPAFGAASCGFTTEMSKR